MEDNGKENKERWLDESQFDVIVLGTGLTESLVAGYYLNYFKFPQQ
jgi:ribulose 1,5-bisphosphate synthetase/thiazole synthase